MADRGTQSEATWWTLGEVVDWIQEIDPTARIGDIRLALVNRCASGRIRAQGHRWLYGFDTILPIDHHDPYFLWFSEQHGRLDASFDEISAGEWKDLAFFARPTLKVGEQYQLTLARAFDELGLPVELRSTSKHRLAWKDVEFWRDDVIREWAHPCDADEPSAAEREPPLAGVRVIAAPVSLRELRGWYQRRISELSAQGQTSSGQEDWEAAKRQFPDRVTRARVRSICEECAPAAWKKQGRRPPGTAE
jgi:hypothetical protein